ncbi:aminopeptidase [Candidatus Woesearchaeota archaeon]|nr:aminopeptidase [Candidatus Woesearchaeota archaeon]
MNGLLKKTLAAAISLSVIAFPKISEADIARTKDGSSYVNVELQNKKVILRGDFWKKKIKGKNVATINFLDDGKVEIYDKNDKIYTGVLENPIVYKQGEEEIKKEGLKQFVVTNGAVKDELVNDALSLVEKIRSYEASAGIEVHNFTYYNDFEPGPLYILRALKKDKLKNDYEGMLGFSSYDKDELMEQKGKLEKRGYNVLIRRVEAVARNPYPITPLFSKATIFRQAMIVLHEDWHNTISLPISIDEGTASIVGNFGALEWIQLEYGKDSKEFNEAIESVNWYANFYNIIIEYYNQLDKVYSSDMKDEEKSEKAGKIISSAKTALDGLDYENEDLGNAFFVEMMTYARHYNLARKVYKKAGNLEEAVKILKATPNKEDEAVNFLETYVK